MKLFWTLLLLVASALAQVPDVVVSPTGSDSTGTGTITNPYATWNKARQAIDTIASGCARSGAAYVVMFRGGTYYMGTPGATTPIAFTSADNGCSLSVPIVYESYPGETAVMDGGFRITGWTQGASSCGGNCTIWTVTLPAGTKYFENLWYNGVRRLRPRLSASAVVLGNTLQVSAAYTENTGNTGQFINCAGLSAPYTCVDRFTYNPTDAGGTINATTIATWVNYQPSHSNPCSVTEGSTTAQEGDIELLIFEQGQTSKERVSCIDTTNLIIYLTGPTYLNASGAALVTPTSFQPNHRYILENINAPTVFDLPKQWFLDVSQNPWKLTYLGAAGENPNNDTVVIPQLSPVVSANNFQYVNFYGLTIQHDNWTIPWANTTTSGATPWTGYAAASSPYNTTYPYQDGYPSLRNELNLTYSSPVYSNGGMNGAFVCLNCQNHEFAYNTLTQTAGGGLDMYTSNTGQTSQGMKIHDNALVDLGGFGSRIGILIATNVCSGCPGNTDTDANIPHAYYYNNNLVSGYGRVIPSSIGLMEGDVRNGIYVHNDINFGYHAALQICALSCSFGTFGASYHGSSNNQVTLNHMHHLMQGLTSDGGALYFNVGATNNTGGGNLVSQNLVHDVSDDGIQDTDGFGGEGIYFDNNSGGSLAIGNIVYFVSDDTLWNTAGPQNSGWANVAQNNIFAYARNGMFGHGGPAWYNVNPPTTIWLQDILKFNVFLFDRCSPNFFVQRSCSSLWGADTGATAYTQYELWDFNTYWGTGSACYTSSFAAYANAFHNQSTQTACNNGSGNWTQSTFANWQGTINSIPMNEDPNGQVANPNFNTTGPTGFNALLTAAPLAGFNYTMTNAAWNTAGRVNPVLYPSGVTIPDTFPGVQSYTPTQY